MKPKQLHQEAMRYSFLAKESLEKGEDLIAYDYYAKAAEIESDVARFYLDKPDLEPTRSTIVRSAAFLNLKAGAIEEAQKFIFWGLLNIEDQQIKGQLDEALEYSIALKNADPAGSHHNFEYLSLLRQKSIYYTIESALPTFGTAVTLATIKEFAEEYLKSLKAYSVFVFKRAAAGIKEFSNDVDAASKQFKELVNPLITSSGFGSFKFSIANDFLRREGENSEVIKLKANILQDYHDNIFTNPLDDVEIGLLKKQFIDDEINEIFRPVTKIKSASSPYKVAYFDRDSFNKIYVGRISREKKRKLLPPTHVSQDDIGILENSIIHARNSDSGKKSRSVIVKEQLKSFEFEIKTNQIDPKEKRPLLLNEEIVINIMFDSDKGFTFEFEELAVEHTEVEYNKGLSGFYSKLYDKLVDVINADPNTGISNELKIVQKLINNPGTLKKKIK